MVAFKVLWDSFPNKDEMAKKCVSKQTPSGAQPFDNYCSILMSECFIKSGISLERCSGQKCWSHPGSKHVIRAEQLASWLAKSPPTGFARKLAVQPASFQTDLSGRSGVIFFKDYWTRGSESFANRSGDHIDLWNGSRITSTWWMGFREVQEWLGFVSDLNKSKEVWFWEVQ
jgi:hypothetical protein